jgi:hypothetical protein
LNYFITQSGRCVYAEYIDPCIVIQLNKRLRGVSKVQKFKLNAYSRKQNEALSIMQTFEKSEGKLIIPVFVTNEEYLWSTDQLKKKLIILSDSCSV